MQEKQANKTTQSTATKRTMRRYSDEFKRELVHYAHSPADRHRHRVRRADGHVFQMDQAVLKRAKPSRHAVSQGN